MNFNDLQMNTSKADLLKIMAKDRCIVVLQHPDEGRAHVYLEQPSFALPVNSQTVRQLLQDGLLMRTEPNPEVTEHLDKLVLSAKGREVANET
jgi:hypothetical protein